MIEQILDPNLAILETVVAALGDLSHSLVCVGGCATGLLLTRVRVNQHLPRDSGSQARLPSLMNQLSESTR